MQTQIQNSASDGIIEIREAYTLALTHRDSALEAAQHCGALLLQVAKAQGEMFGDWLGENLPEVKRAHAVNFIKLAQRSALNYGARQHLLSLADEPEKTDSSPERARVESHLLFVSRICSWFGKRTKANPLEKWEERDRARLKTELEPLAKIYAAL